MVESLLTIVPRYGLANRMRALASGVILGETMGFRICFYWEKNELCNCSFTKLFDSDLIQVESPLMGTTDDQVFFSKEEMIGGVIRIGDDEREKNLVVESFNPFMLESVGREDFQEMLSRKIREVFSPSTEVRSKLIDLPEKCVGVHVRRRDSVPSRRESTDAAFLVSMDRALVEDGETCFFLSTDSNEVKRVMTEKYGTSKIITREIDSRRSSDSGIIDALVDMFMLSKTKRILGSYGSSFSTIAGMLGNTPQYPVIDQRARERAEEERGEIDRLLENAERDMEKRDFESAIIKYTSIEKRFPYYYGVQIRLANAYEGKGDFVRAKQSLEAYVEDYPLTENLAGMMKRIDERIREG